MDVILSQALPTSIMGNYTGSTTYKMNKNAAETEKCGDKSTGICASCSNKECAYRR